MSQQPPQDDPKNIWRKQNTDPTRLSVEEVRQKAQKFLSKSRRDNAIGLAFSFVVVLFCAIALLTARQTAARVIAGLVMTMMVVRLVRTIYFPYKKYGRLWPTVTFDRDVALTTCLEFYRSELERQRDLARQPFWQLAVTLLIIGWLIRDALIGTSLDLLSVALPFVLFAAAGLVLLLTVRKFEARRVQSELDALDRFEEEKH